MAKSTLTRVNSKTVRTAFVTGALDASKVIDAKGNPVSTASLFGADGTGEKVRGRLKPEFVQAFLDANPGTEFVEGAQANVKTVEVPRKSAKGRDLKPAVLPIAEVRALAGVEGKKGRLSRADLARAGQALMAQAK